MEISSDSYSQVENVLDFITLLVFKDEVEADKNETMESSRNSMEYLGAYFKTDDLTDQEREIVIRNYKEMNPYYDNLWKKYEVPPYISRQAKDFDIIYEPVNMLTVNSVLSNYRIVYKRVLTYFYFSTYSKANESKENYRNFCLFMINMMAFMNYMNKWMENPYDVDMMSEKLVDRFMASFGITYFSNAPLHYKRRIAKNMNRLISRKGTDKVIVDILDIFDFNNINIFKYYLVRDETIVNSDGSNEVIKNPRFISHNIRIPSLSEAIRSNNYRVNPIRSVTETDKTWQTTESEIATYDFDIAQTKYFSIESGFELSKEGLGTVFILNLIKKIRQDYIEKDYLTVNSAAISEQPIAIEDIIIALQVLTLEYHDIVDSIQYDMENMYSIYQYSDNDNYELNEMFRLPDGTLDQDYILENLSNVDKFDQESINQVITRNSSVYKKMMERILAESDYKKYQKLRSLYYSKFTQKLSYEIFRGHKTYGDYLKSQNEDLHNYVTRLQSIEDKDTKRVEIERAITLLTDIMKSYLNNTELFFGSTSIDIFSSYLREVIEVFKSFTVTLRDLNFFIIVQEEIDGRLFDYIDDLQGFITIIEKLEGDMLISDYYRFFKRRNFNDKVHLHDSIFTTVKLDEKITTDYLILKDAFNLSKTYLNSADKITLVDGMTLSGGFSIHDNTKFADFIYGITGGFYKIDLQNLSDEYKFNTKLYWKDYNLVKDYVVTDKYMSPEDEITFKDFIFYPSPVTFFLKDPHKLREKIEFFKRKALLSTNLMEISDHKKFNGKINLSEKVHLNDYLEFIRE